METTLIRSLDSVALDLEIEIDEILSCYDNMLDFLETHNRNCSTDILSKEAHEVDTSTYLMDEVEAYEYIRKTTKQVIKKTLIEGAFKSIQTKLTRYVDNQ